MDARVVSKAISPHRAGAESPEGGYFHSVSPSNFDGTHLSFAGRTLAENQMHLRTNDENRRPTGVEVDDMAAAKMFDAKLAERAKRLKPRGIGLRSGATEQCALEVGAVRDAAVVLPGGAEETRLCVNLV